MNHQSSKDLTGCGAYLSPDVQPGSAPWRREVVSRLAAHRARRRRRLDPEGAMNFDFEPAVEPLTVKEGSISSASLALWRARMEQPQVEAEFQDLSSPSVAQELCEQEAVKVCTAEPLPLSAGSANIVEFPRPQRRSRIAERRPTAAPSDELAEPIDDQLRIFEVAEEPVPHFAVPRIELESGQAEEAQPEIELPLRVAPSLLRVGSALLDLMVVICATAIFAIVTLFFLKSSLPAHVSLMRWAAAPTIFWSFYQTLFLIGCGHTPGMGISHLEVLTFEGKKIPMQLRQWRAAALLMSLFSCGMGFAWALLDEDHLGWHDRITRTYLATRE